MIGARIRGTLLRTYQRRLAALWRGMKTNLTSIGTAAVAATMLLAGSAHAAAKPAPAKSSAPSLGRGGREGQPLRRARTARSAPTTTRPRRSSSIVGAQGSALAKRQERPAHGPDARDLEAPSTRCRTRIAKRDWSAAAKNYNYASWVDLKTGKLVLQTNAPRAVTAGLSKDYSGVIEQQRRERSATAFSPPRRHLAVLGWQLDQERRLGLLVRLHRCSGAASASWSRPATASRSARTRRRPTATCPSATSSSAARSSPGRSSRCSTWS